MNIELEVTLRCNAACPHCSRHCNRLSQPDTDMSLDQINRFAKEVRDVGTPLNILSVMGGEPTLHPQINEIMEILEQLKQDNLIKTFNYVSNGILPPPKAIKKAIVSMRPPKYKYHRRMDIDPSLNQQEVVKECEIPYTCGAALNIYGYWPCGAGGALARLLGIDVAKYTLVDAMKGFDMSLVCPHCQKYAKNPIMVAGSDNIPPSDNYKKAFEAFVGYKGRLY